MVPALTPIPTLALFLTPIPTPAGAFTPTCPSINYSLTVAIFSLTNLRKERKVLSIFGSKGSKFDVLFIVMHIEPLFDFDDTKSCYF